MSRGADDRAAFHFLAVKISVQMKGGHMPKRGENIYKRKDGRKPSMV